MCGGSAALLRGADLQWKQARLVVRPRTQMQTQMHLADAANADAQGDADVDSDDDANSGTSSGPGIANCLSRANFGVFVTAWERRRVGAIGI